LSTRPYDTYESLRRTARAFRTEKAWLIPRYADVEAGLRDTRLTARRAQHLFPQSQVPTSARELHDTLSRWTFFSDLHELKTDRQAVWNFLGPDRLAQLPQLLRRWARSQINLWKASTPPSSSLQLDLLTKFAKPLRHEVIRLLFEDPKDDVHHLCELSDLIFALMTASTPTPEQVAKAVEAHRELREKLAAWCSADSDSATPRQASTKSVATKLRDIGANAEAWPEQLMLMFVTSVFIEKSWANTLGVWLNATLMQSPKASRWTHWKSELLKAEDGNSTDQPAKTRLELGIQEALRLESPTQITSRVAQVDLEFAGEQIRAGDRIALLIGSANYDESAFANASKFDLQRFTTAASSALTFGAGGKRCPGAWLSTNVIGSTLQVFLEDIQDLELDSQELRWQENLESRRLVELPVRLSF